MRKWFITTMFNIILFLFFFRENIYMKGTNEWYVAFLKLLEFYDLYLVITEKLVGVMSCLAFFTQKFNIVKEVQRPC